MYHFIRHRGGRFAGPEGDQSGDGHGDGAGHAVGEVCGDAGQCDRHGTGRLHFAAGGDAGAVGRLPAGALSAGARESAGGLRGVERVVAPDSGVAAGAHAPRFYRVQDGDGPAEDRTADERPPDRAGRRLRAVCAGEPDGTRSALQGTADQRDEFFPRPAGVGRPGGENSAGADRGAARARADSRLGAGVRHRRGGVFDRDCAAGMSGAVAAAQRRAGVRHRSGCAGDRDGAGRQVSRGDRGGRARGVARALFHARESPLRDQQGDAEPRGVCAAEPDLRSAVHAAGLDLLPQSADLLGGGAAKTPPASVPLRPETRRAPVSGRLGNHRRPQRSVPAPGPPMEAVPVRRNGRRGQPGVVSGRHRGRDGPAGRGGAGACDERRADLAAGRAGAAQPVRSGRRVGQRPG